MTEVFILLGVFSVALVWFIWGVTYRMLVPSYAQGRIAAILAILGITLGAATAGNVGSQLVKAIIALS